MLKHLRLSHLSPFRQVSLDFGPRLAVFTGDNSVGKSLLLEAAWWGLTGTWAGLVVPTVGHRQGAETAQIEAAVVDEMRQRGEGEMFEHTNTYQMRIRPGDASTAKNRGRQRQRAIVVHARLDGGFVISDPIKADRAFALGTSAGVPNFMTFSAQELWDGNAFCNGLVRDLETWRLRRSEQYTVLERVLLVLSAAGEELKLGDPVRISVDDPREIPTLELPYGAVPVTHASAGIRGSTLKRDHSAL